MSKHPRPLPSFVVNSRERERFVLANKRPRLHPISIPFVKSPCTRALPSAQAKLAVIEFAFVELRLGEEEYATLLFSYERAPGRGWKTHVYMRVQHSGGANWRWISDAVLALYERYVCDLWLTKSIYQQQRVTRRNVYSYSGRFLFLFFKRLLLKSSFIRKGFYE